MTEQIEETLGFDWHKILAIGLILLTLAGSIAAANGGGGATNSINKWLFSKTGTIYSGQKGSIIVSNTNPAILINSAISKSVTGDTFDFQGTVFTFTGSTGFAPGAKSLIWVNGIFQTAATCVTISFTGPSDGLTTMTMTDFTFNETSITSNLCVPTIQETGFLAPFFLNVQIESTDYLSQWRIFNYWIPARSTR